MQDTVELIDSVMAGTSHSPTLATLTMIRAQCVEAGQEIERLRGELGALLELANEGQPRVSATQIARDRLADLTSCPPLERSDILAVLRHAAQWIEAVSEYTDE